MSARQMNNNQQALYETEDRWRKRLEMARETGVFTYQALNWTWDLPTERWFTNLEQCETYIKDVANMEGIRQMRGDTPGIPTVVESKYNNRAHYLNGKIAIPDHSKWRRELTLLHEMGHYYGGSGHGKRFLAAYSKLIEVAMSPVLAHLLLAELDKEIKSHNE